MKAISAKDGHGRNMGHKLLHILGACDLHQKGQPHIRSQQLANSRSRLLSNVLPSSDDYMRLKPILSDNHGNEHVSGRNMVRMGGAILAYLVSSDRVKSEYPAPIALQALFTRARNGVHSF